MKKLALLGAARPGLEERIAGIIKIKKCGYCWIGWSYGINSSAKLKLLDNQLGKDKDGFFYLYYHEIEKPEHEEIYGRGTGFVEYRLKIDKYQYTKEYVESPSPKCTANREINKKHRLWVRCSEKPEKIPSQKWNTFNEYDTGENLSGPFPFRFRNVEFAYIS